MKFKRSGIIMIAIILAIIVFAVIRISTIRSQIAEVEAGNQAQQEKVDTLTQENAELTYELEHSDDPETIEDIARDSLDLVKPGEKIFVDLNG